MSTKVDKEKMLRSCIHTCHSNKSTRRSVTFSSENQYFERELNEEEIEQLEQKGWKDEKEKKWFTNYLAKSLGVYFGPDNEPLLDEVSFEGIARYLASDKCSKVVVLTGAGISTSAGIPDYRSPNTGLLATVKAKYPKMKDPKQLLELEYFIRDPKPFFTFRKDMFAIDYKPTPSHYFVKLLEVKGKLLRLYTQNIDGLHGQAGLDPARIVEAHGTMDTAHCIYCYKHYTKEQMRAQMYAHKDSLVPYCTEEDCDGFMKPDIVMFGESLERNFMDDAEEIENCDFMLIMGTAMKVQPFSKLPIKTKFNVPRLYINLEKPQVARHPMTALFFGGGYDFDNEDNIRDVFVGDKCDDACFKLADLVGWGDEFRAMVQEENAKRGVVWPPSVQKPSPGPSHSKTDKPCPPTQSKTDKPQAAKNQPKSQSSVNKKTFSSGNITTQSKAVKTQSKPDIKIAARSGKRNTEKP
ncbi:NAD-dependent protein deacetylase sirtuin-2-like [Mya arenaria]|uniref:NAD-dependent protein deacetylase sirtuin-2-like n=1 Tax=Mya arenaria TaxID=6604 RepID=UPI0022E4E03A|nr:NAD-dependent protein deacetylase sirtuin-2-like [Mya arenaria]